MKYHGLFKAREYDARRVKDIIIELKDI